MSTQIAKSRMIFKVIVLGRDISLQTGFLCRAAGNNVSTQLFNTLGISLGVARRESTSDTAVAIQLWALPLTERLPGLKANFLRGNRGAIIVIRANELESIPILIESFSIAEKSELIIAVIRSENEGEIDLSYLDSILDTYASYDTHSVDDIIEVATELLLSKNKNEKRPAVCFLDEESCPLFEIPNQYRKESISPDEDVAKIQTVLLDQGLRVIEDSCVVKLDEGTALISLRTGAISFEPIICEFCLNSCKRKNSICIIAVDSGWSSHGVGQKALLTTAKAIALAERSFPNHVEMQIQRASRCSKFILDPMVEDQVIPEILTDCIKENQDSDRSLLDIARDRLNEGKLSISAFNMLKSRFEAVKKLLTD